MNSGSPRVCLFGCALDTGNLGVSALGYSVLDALVREGINVTLMDHSRGHGHLAEFGDRVVRCGCRYSRRFYRSDTAQTIRVFSAVWRGGGNYAAARLRDADAVLDISGGDSFTDLYGCRRFRSVTAPKFMALERRKPLILLPQTFGPFHSTKCRRTAAGIVQRASLALARDEQSFSALKDLLGDSFDPNRHESGVDVAFLLSVVKPSANLMPAEEAWFHQSEAPVAGLNVSGLIYNDAQRAREAFGFIADYSAVVRGLAEGLLHRGARIILVPHVVTPTGHYESDVEAAQRVLDSLPRCARERIAVAPAYRDPREVKWLIGRCDWFCGTRMHATIAGLSQGIPTAAVAYSMKTQGVFNSCGQGDHVADPRCAETADLIDRLLASFDSRAASRAVLAERLTTVRQRATEQMRHVTSMIRATSTSPAL